MRKRNKQQRRAVAAMSEAVIIAEWERNSRESIRVSLSTFNGRNIVDVRAWWRDGTGQLRPGKSGITLGVSHLPALASALAKAERRAQDAGLLTESKADAQSA